MLVDDLFEYNKKENFPKGKFLETLYSPDLLNYIDNNKSNTNENNQRMVELGKLLKDIFDDDFMSFFTLYLYDKDYCRQSFLISD